MTEIAKFWRFIDAERSPDTIKKGSPAVQRSFREIQTTIQAIRMPIMNGTETGRRNLNAQ